VGAAVMRETRGSKELLRVLVNRPVWMERAACAGMTDLFYPEGPGPVPKAAQLVCELCPVTRECLGYAVATSQRYGTWGGMGTRQRRRVRAGILALIKKGTYL
jgi:WhiB family redox-sensing transcriptional regulator